MWLGSLWCLVHVSVDDIHAHVILSLFKEHVPLDFAGDVICFHNYRVLHGREKYEIRANEERLLEGSYLDWDEMRSKRRALDETS